MLSPEPMRHLLLVVLGDDLEATTRAIAAVGVLHLLDLRRVGEAPAAIRPFEVGERIARLDALTRDLDGILDHLGVPRAAPEAAGASEEPLDLAAAEASAEAIAREVDALGTASTAADEEQQLRALLRGLRALAPLATPLEQLSRLRWVHVAVGSLPEREVPALRQRLADLTHVLELAGGPRQEERETVVALCLRADAEALERALRAARFERLELPRPPCGTAETVIAQLEARLEEARQRRQALVAERQVLAHRVAPAVLSLRARAARERLLVEAQRMMGRSERTALVSGWVPAALARRLEHLVRSVTRGRCVFQWQAPSSLEGVRRGGIAVPILLRNPVLVRPFERLLRGYGLPRYGELEPTPIVALAFLSMFGFMFGDVGQGAVLFAIGYFVHRRMFRYRDYAVILMECGVFAIAFGFLYGSVFGMERWLPALWLRPLENVQTLVVTALGFGVVLLSIGMLLNLANAVRQRNASALWERSGLPGALAYWIAVGLLVRRMTAGPGAVTLGTAVLWLAVPVAMILLREPLRELWAAVQARRLPEPGEMLALGIQSLVEVLDTALAHLANTATFIRLAAFALSHAGLFLATFSVADVVAKAGGGRAGAVLVVVIGNALIIALEGMIVAIQSIRLEYYELFSKFYSGGGEEYRPLRLPAALPGREPERWTHARTSADV